MATSPPSGAYSQQILALQQQLYSMQCGYEERLQAEHELMNQQLMIKDHQLREIEYQLLMQSQLMEEQQEEDMMMREWDKFIHEEALQEVVENENANQIMDDSVIFCTEYC